MLRCEVSGAADVRYSWLHNSEPVLDSERRFQEGNNLKFTAVDRHLDSGAFQCVATDAVLGEEARSNNASFNIKCECGREKREFSMCDGCPKAVSFFFFLCVCCCFKGS